MKNRFFEEDEFKKWLVTNQITSEDSAYSYCSYVNSVEKNFHFNSKVEDIASGKLNKTYPDLIIEILQALSEKNIAEKINKSSKTLRNWKSGFIAYGEYLATNFENSTETGSEEISKDNYTSFDSEYSKEDIYKNFTFRLITQDRFYENLYFPVSFIKRIFYRNKEKLFFDNWINSILDDTVLHFKDSENLLKNISHIFFDNQGIKAKILNNVSNLYTKLPNNIDKEPFISNEMKKIALDHCKPMLTIIRDNHHQLIELQKITNDINRIIGKGKINRTALSQASRQLFEQSYLDTINLNQLKAELNIIADETSLQLMDAKFNSSKGAN
ncbi:hypothetical protein EV144_1011429 [Flavobacterium sp. 270]|uniref:hypothetical protein n=1 Tax=Flavobacterium sp. 270 TaxID=2512114 RepID=UPI001065D0C9|nr:hypothetical protein [Flavobacterium sp. 270]TDW52736.1 hypothetical protein EV144_1011429 [Flavobacterium sp. 270]